MKTMLRAATIFATVILASHTSFPQNSLDSRVRAEITPFKGKVFLYAKNLDTGQIYSYNGDERVRTASTIKIAVMIEVWSRVAEGKAKWTDELVLTKAARYSGSGILPELGDGLRLTLQDCVRLMMTLSDNTATNMINSLPTVSRDIIAPIIRTSAEAMLARPRRNDRLELAPASLFSLLHGRGYNRCSESRARFGPRLEPNGRFPLKQIANCG